MDIATTYVVLVDENDKRRGFMEKIEAHEKGELHRAFSVFIFNNKNELLLQRRADHKYHSGGLWTNTCCSHPKPGESNDQAALRRLEEEMGITGVLQEEFSFVYKHEFENGMIEHELDHVFFGWTDDLPKVNSEEVAEYTYVPMDRLHEKLKSNPELYTPWFHICFDRVYEAWKVEIAKHFAS